MEKKATTIEIYDKDHIWFEHRQFVSLERFMEVKKEMIDEAKCLMDKVKKLEEQNKALKTLLGVVDV